MLTLVSHGVKHKNIKMIRWIEDFPRVNMHCDCITKMYNFEASNNLDGYFC